jgi:N,N'-diacetyllegionaminate synthase
VDSVVNLQIGTRSVGPDQPCFIIAEAGVNHNGDITLARKLVDAAVATGADAVKFQTFKTEALLLGSAPKAAYQKKTTSAIESQFEMVKRLELPFEDFANLSQYCAARGIIFLSTPFDYESADYLAKLEMAAFKISSGEVTNHPFLEHIAAKSKPIILSTGMCDLQEVSDAVALLKNAGAGELALLQCTSNYPASPADINLRAMHTMKEAFDVPVGYSDHTAGIEIAGAAVALGASILEKHFTLDRNMRGPDHQASLEPDEFRAMVQSIRNIESALGDGRKRPSCAEEDTAIAARRSLVAACDIPAGVRIEKRHLTALRPSGGIGPNFISSVIGKQAIRPVKAGSLLTWEDLK